MFSFETRILFELDLLVTIGMCQQMIKRSAFHQYPVKWRKTESFPSKIGNKARRPGVLTP